MSDKNPSSQRLETRESIKHHRTQTTWQILVPMLLLSAGFVALMVLLVLTLEDNQYFPEVAHLSTILLVVPIMLLGLLFLAVLIVGIILIRKATLKLPDIGLAGQVFALRFQQISQKISRALVLPVFKVRESRSIINQIGKKLFQRSK